MGFTRHNGRGSETNASTSRTGAFALGYPDDSGCETSGDSAPAVSQKPGELSVSDWIGEIRKVWENGAANTPELAGIVCRLRELLSCAEWKELWQPGRMPFRIRKAYALVAIGNGLGWVDLQTFAQLPRGWSILQHLAKLERRLLERLIEEEVVHPELTFARARELVAQSTGNRRAARRPNVNWRVQTFANFVDSTLDDWTTQERTAAARILGSLIQRIRSKSESTPTTPNPSIP